MLEQDLLPLLPAPTIRLSRFRFFAAISAGAGKTLGDLERHYLPRMIDQHPLFVDRHQLSSIRYLTAELIQILLVVALVFNDCERLSLAQMRSADKLQVQIDALHHRLGGGCLLDGIEHVPLDN